MIYGFHHVYVTKHGERIFTDQQLEVRSSGLWDATEVLTVGYSRPTDKPQLYEGSTLGTMWDMSQIFDGYVWYIHTKGASHDVVHFDRMKKIRDELQSVTLYEWQHCIEALNSCDCYGYGIPGDNRYFFPVNFWWSTFAHIRRLPRPRLWAESICGRTGENIRYGYEDWITGSLPGTIAKAKNIWIK